MPAPLEPGAAPSALERILELARWAPSGDNSQPWRFEVAGPDHVVVHAFDTRSTCVYDLDGRASQLSVGALLETMRIAATAEGWGMAAAVRPGEPEERPLIDVRFSAEPGLAADPLVAVIRTRSVQRKPLQTRALCAAARTALERAAGPGYTVRWFEGAGPRRRLAWLASRSAKIRLTIPEAYAVHREIIEWNARFSADRVPDQALGADPLSLRSMRWVMASWDRVRMMNRWFGGTVAPRLQLDLWPGLRCAAHFVIVGPKPPASLEDQLAAGAAVQRFWLTSTSLGIQLQPQYSPLVFAKYAREGTGFTSDPAALARAKLVDRMLAGLLGAAAARAAVFMGRVGYGAAPTSRSLRLTLDQLRWAADDDGPRHPGRP